MRNKPLPGMMKHSPAKQTKGPTMPKNHPVTPPTEEQSKKDKGQPQGYLGENAWRNRAATFSEIDMEQRREGYEGNKQKIKKFFGW